VYKAVDKIQEARVSSVPAPRARSAEKSGVRGRRAIQGLTVSHAENQGVPILGAAD
jgi:hypothetical protein